VDILKEYQETALTAKQDQFKEFSSTTAMSFNEPIEAMDYDKNKSRLAVSSHTGKIKMFHVEKNGMKNSTRHLYV